MKFLTIFLFLVKESISVEPDEILENKELEKVAREIGKSLRCLVCQVKISKIQMQI